MPSYARRHQLSNSLVYHVFNRSNGREFIFKNAEDFRHFIHLLKAYARKFTLGIYHWVIMSNHYHLLLELADPYQLSRFMAGLNRAYTHYYHKVNQTSGLLWPGRFKSQPVQKEHYMLACARYIERNPVAAGIVKEAADYPYSSARYYCFGSPDAITTTDQMYLGLSDNIVKRQSEYTRFLQDFNPEEENLFAGLEFPAGNAEFIKRLIRENGRLLPRKTGRIKK